MIDIRNLKYFGRFLAVSIALIAGGVIMARPASAQGGIRDAETEALIAEYSAPIFRAAGLESSNIRIRLVGDRTFNAFVVDGKNMFLHIGAILKSSTPNQIIGVIAHETGHIAGSHITRMQTQLARAQQAAFWFQLLGMASMAAGAVSGGNDAISGGAAVMYGGQNAAFRSFLMYRRAEEASADQAGIKYLNATKQSARGMLETFKLFVEQSSGGRSVDPYAQTHPMPQDRIAQLQELAVASPYFNNKDSAELQLRHDMVRAKVDAFMNRKNRSLVLREYPESNQSLPARYARAIVTCYSRGARAAVPLIDELISVQPNNPYFYEFKGQCLLEEGGSMQESVAPLRRAVQLAPKSPLIKSLLAQALLATNNPSSADEAVSLLKKSIEVEKENAEFYRLLAAAYGKQNQQSYAALATAEQYYYSGRYKDAKQQAQRAQIAFPFGSKGWNEAQEILDFKPPNTKN